MSWFSIVKRNFDYDRYLDELSQWGEQHFGSLMMEDPQFRSEGEQYELNQFNRYLDELKSYKDNPSKHKDRINRIEDRLLDVMDVSNLPMLPDSFFDEDTFEKKAGGVSFGGHGANPELFNIKYGGGKRGKKRRKKKVRD